MGANAQTSVPLFTAGEVLTATNQNLSAGTGVPVFATTTTRDAAFGGTGEKVLAEGQLCYVENLTGDAQIQYYDGSTWNSLGASGLTLISSTTIGSAVSSVTVSNAFSSTYDNYKILVSGGLGSATSSAISLQLGATTTNYSHQFAGGSYNNTASVLGATGATNFLRAGGIETNYLFMNVDVLGPNLAVPTTFSGSFVHNGSAAFIGGVQSATTQFTAFTLIPSSGTLTGGTIRVYGYRN